MTRRILLSAVILAQAALAQSGAVEAAEKAWVAGITKGDAAALDQVLSLDLVYTHSNGRTESKSEYVAAVTSGKTKYQSVDYDEMKVKQFGDSAFVAGKARVKLLSSGNPVEMTVRVLHIWVKQNGRWQLAAHQSTRLP